VVVRRSHHPKPHAGGHVQYERPISVVHGDVKPVGAAQRSDDDQDEALELMGGSTN
jgi:hypothetical protein